MEMNTPPPKVRHDCTGETLTFFFLNKIGKACRAWLLKCFPAPFPGVTIGDVCIFFGVMKYSVESGCACMCLLSSQVAHLCVVCGCAHSVKHSAGCLHLEMWAGRKKRGVEWMSQQHSESLANRHSSRDGWKDLVYLQTPPFFCWVLPPYQIRFCSSALFGTSDSADGQRDRMPLHNYFPMFCGGGEINKDSDEL